MTETLQLPLQSYYRRAFPERKNATISGLACLNNGWESDVYAFSAEWDGGTDEQVLRIYPGADAVEKSAREYRALRLLHAAGYPVPRVDRREGEDSPLGKPFLIMERIHGSGMWHPMFNSPLETCLQHGRTFCELFARLHALDWRPFAGESEDPAGDMPQNLAERQVARWKPYAEALPLPGFHAGMEWLFERSRSVSSLPPSLAHWDFHPDNILLREPDGAPVVIDWTGLEITDRRFDLAWSLLLISCVEGAWVRELLLREYERQSGMVMEDMDFFDAAACFRRLFSVGASLAYGAEQMGMRPGAEEQMRRQAPRLRFVYERLLEITHLPVPEVEAMLRELGV